MYDIVPLEKKFANPAQTGYPALVHGGMARNTGRNVRDQIGSRNVHIKNLLAIKSAVQK